MQSVLLLDDNPVNLKWLELLVQRLEQAQCASFTDPLAALEYARTHHVDLVVLDYLMPEMNGLQFIDAFGAMEGTQSVPLLMITAHDEKDVRYRALEAGAYDFLLKPVDAAEFLARARNLLKLREASLRLADHAALLTREVELATREIRERERETVMSLVKAAGYRDYETGAHIARVGHYANLIAKGLQLSAQDQALMLDAAAMHDIGKVGIPDHILLKPGRLDEAEMAIMREHASLGYDLLKGSSSSLLQAGATIALGHHEKFDGSGYPQGLRGQDIPLFGRIVAVADVFDALTSERPYKKPWSLEDAADYLRAQRGLHFDPQCVDVFLAAWPEVLAIRQRFTDEPKSPAPWVQQPDAAAA
jgi:response regulator RpfG family c-di-GMP phosphodiesterase